MKTGIQYRALIILGLLSVLLAGCSLATEANQDSLAPLQDAAWPTPRPTVEAPSPTPFPKVDPSQVRRLDEMVGVGLAPAKTGATAPTLEVVGAGLAPAQTGATAEAAPTASDLSARVRGPKGVNVRKGPGTSPQSLLVFQLSSGGDIMIANADGSGLRGLTRGIDPVLSPDGQQIAFTRWDGTDGSLWVIGVDGSGERQVAGGIKQAKHPTWSPDGKRVAVNLQHEGRLDPARKCTNLVTGGVPDIPWNVDKDSVDIEMRGQYPYIMPYLCYTDPPDPHWSVRVVDVATGKAEDQVTDTYAFGPEWDPAHPWRIVTSGLNGLDQIDVNRQALWELTDRREDHTPAFSPDGTYIAVAYNQGGRYDIHRLDAGGGGRVNLTELPLWLAAEGKKPWNSVAPAWSPDGSRIAFLTDRTGRWEIWMMGADGSNPQPMFDDSLNDQLKFNYGFVDERMLSWGGG